MNSPRNSWQEPTPPFLIRAGLILKDDQGRRQLSVEGREHLSNSRQKSV